MTTACLLRSAHWVRQPLSVSKCKNDNLKKRKTILIVSALLIGILLLKTFKNYNRFSNSDSKKEVLKRINLEKDELIELAKELITINKYIKRDSIVSQKFKINTVTIETIRSTIFQQNGSEVTLGVPYENSDFYKEYYYLDSLDQNILSSIRNKSKRLNFYTVKMDTLNRVSFEILNGRTPLLINSYSLIYSESSYTSKYEKKIDEYLYFNTELEQLE